MGNALGILFNQLKEIWSHFGVNQKVSTIMGLLITIAVMSSVFYWSSRPSYRLLYSGMTLEDAAAAQEKISDERISVQLKDSGRSIYVPAGDVYRARLLLAAEGLPKDSSTGFELFEQPKFGLTDFAQKVNYQRALQGELARTISTMDGINSARVLLVLPKDKLFASEAEKKAKASIMINVAGGAVLSVSQTRSIKRLVGSAVPGLSPSAIMITDQNGTLLSQGMGSDENEVAVAGEQVESQIKIEKALAGKAQEMLDASFGSGQSIVRVSVALDFSKVDRRKETFDTANRIVISETISTENTSTPSVQSRSGGSTTVSVRNPGKIQGGAGNSTSKKEDISTQYKVPSGVEHVVESGSRIKNLSISVCVAQGEVSRTKEEMMAIEDMIKTAVGFTSTDIRKDSIHVAEMKFVAPLPAPIPGLIQQLPFSMQSILNGLFGFVVLIVIVVVSRRIMATLSVQSEDVGVSVSALSVGPGSRELLGQGAMIPEGTELKPMEQATFLAQQDPAAVAAWITNMNKGGR